LQVPHLPTIRLTSCLPFTTQYFDHSLHRVARTPQ
jgi:hypothetical protein